MPVFTDINHLPSFKNAVLTIGTFDGVHLGHRAILREVAAQAAAASGESVLITFEPHPRKLLYPEQSLQLLTPLSDKIELLLANGIHNVVVAPFTAEFAALTAKEYIRDFLVAKFHPQSIVIGYDHRFGHDRCGDLALLKTFGTKYGFTVAELSAQMIDDATVSSTKIRKALLAGAVATANAMLGHPYQLTGTIISGAQIGRQLGFPTANVQPVSADQLIPANGVYAITATVEGSGQSYKGMLNIGIRPTVSSELKLHIEAHLFDFNQDIYGKQLTLSFHQRLRDEQKFPSLDALKAQLAQDKVAAQAILSQ